MKGKLNYRQFFMILILLFITAAEILFDYINAGFDPTIFYNASYWVRLAVTCLSVILVTITVRDFFRERELNSNAGISKAQSSLDTAHTELAKYDLMTKLETFIAETNRIRKYKAYNEYLQFKQHKSKERKKTKWAKLIDTAEKDADFLPVIGKHMRLSWFTWIKYNKVSVATIFARSGHAKTDDDDLDSNESADIGQMLFKKLLPLIALSVSMSTLFFDNGEFAVAILINTFIKLFRIAMSMYTGAVTGQEYVRASLLTKMERRLDFIQKFLERERQPKE